MAVKQLDSWRPAFVTRAQGSRAAQALGRRGRRFLLALAPLFRRAGFDLIERTYYSPVPDVRAVPETFWTRRRDLDGVDLDLRPQLEFLRGQLGGHLAEFRSALADGGPLAAYDLENGTYGRVDSALLYAMLRHARPARVVELGSGASSRVMAAALERNMRDGHPASYSIYDPYPGASLERDLGGAASVRRISATDIPLDTFRELRAGDVLFVDTTHTVKVAGDVDFALLEAVPALGPGAYVHFHDIFLPWEYPREWVEDKGYFWAEQDLLQAFLAFNADFGVVLAAQALVRSFPDEVAETVPTFRRGPWPGAGAFWLRRLR